MLVAQAGWSEGGRAAAPAPAPAAGSPEERPARRPGGTGGLAKEEEGRSTGGSSSSSSAYLAWLFALWGPPSAPHCGAGGLSRSAAAAAWELSCALSAPPPASAQVQQEEEEQQRGKVWGVAQVTAARRTWAELRLVCSEKAAGSGDEEVSVGLVSGAGQAPPAPSPKEPETSCATGSRTAALEDLQVETSFSNQGVCRGLRGCAFKRPPPPAASIPAL